MAIFKKKAPSIKKQIKIEHEEELSIQNQAPDPKRQATTTYQRQDTKSPNPFAVKTNKVNTRVSPLSGILLFMAGLLAMFLFMQILVMPAYLQDGMNQIAILNTALDTRQTIHDAAMEDSVITIASLEAQIAQYQEEASHMQEEAANLQNENWVNTAYTYLSLEMASQALAVLANVDIARLTESSTIIYNVVLQTATPMVEEYYHAMGLELFNAGEMASARVALEQAAMHITGASQLAHDTLYLLGVIAEHDEDFSLARAYFEKVINEHPGSNRANAAQLGLNRIQAAIDAT